LLFFNNLAFLRGERSEDVVENKRYTIFWNEANKSNLFSRLQRSAKNEPKNVLEIHRRLLLQRACQIVLRLALRMARVNEDRSRVAGKQGSERQSLVKIRDEVFGRLDPH